VADFLRRNGPGEPKGILLIDEIDAHLHPRWQRTILPAIKDALSGVQIIVTSHSPFVITSCPGARVHVLEVNETTNRAQLSRSMDAPFGGSLMAAIQGIFDVHSRFDPKTEAELNEWNELKKKQVSRTISATESSRLKSLTSELSKRSHELHSIVSSPQIPDSVVKSLLGNPKNGSPARAGRPKRKQPT
jgi:predicted ATP-binding protein involved in virulence